MSSDVQAADEGKDVASGVYLRIENIPPSKISFFKAVKEYLPQMISPTLDIVSMPGRPAQLVVKHGCEEVEEMFRNYSHQLRMYGSAHEFYENLQIFRNHGVDHLFLDLGVGEPYTTTPVVYKSLKGESFISRPDVFVHMQNMVFHKCQIIRESPPARALIAVYLKTISKPVDCHALLPCSLDAFQTMGRDFDELMRNASRKPHKIGDNTIEASLEPFMKLMPASVSDENQMMVYLSLAMMNGSPDYYSTLYSACHNVLNILKIFRATRGILFSSDHEGERLPNVVRLFVDGNRTFFPDDELLEIQGRLFHRQCGYDTWRTHDGNLLLNLPEAEKNFEIVRVPIVRAKHRAAFVWSRDGVPHIPAADMIFELLYEWIIGMQLFQRIDESSRLPTTMMKFIMQFSSYFEIQPDVGELPADRLIFSMRDLPRKVFFVPVSVFHEMKQWTIANFSKILKRPAKEVRNVNKDGFTVKDLKNELIHLELNRIFPSITDHVERVYAHVCKEKKERVLRTCDLFDAVWHCQLIEFFKTFENFHRFVHIQYGCHRVLLDCPLHADEPSSSATDPAHPVPSLPTGSVDSRPCNSSDSQVARPEVAEAPKTPVPLPEVAEAPKMASNVHLEGRDASISVSSFLKVIQRYIPNTIFIQAKLKRIELPETFFFEEDGRKEVQDLLDNSNNKFRMYGTAVELCQNLKVYRQFPRNYHFFDFDICEPYSTKPLIYKNQNNEEFICKQDVYTHIMNMILNKFDVIKENLFARAIIVLFLKWTESTVSVAHEFVSCTNEQFASIETSLVEMMRERMKNPRSVRVPNGFNEILDLFAALLPMAWDDNKFATIRIFLQEVMRRLPPRVAPEHYLQMYNACESLIDALKQIIKDRPAIFKPDEELVTDPMPRLTLRMFEDGKEKFLAWDEMHATMSACIGRTEVMDTRSIDRLPTFNTSSTNGQEMIKRFMPHVDFIRVPIVRSKHRALWVYSRSGTPYILASDAFFELLYEWTFGLKLFQRLRNENESRTIIGLFFEVFGDYFSRPTPDNIFLISNHSYENMKEWNRKAESELGSRPANDVRNAKKDGFTEQNLKNELVHLGLDRIFPRITEHTGVVYAHVCKEKKERVLRTCDLFDAIYHCVLIAFIKCFNYTSFVHSQNGCHRVLKIDCPQCNADNSPGSQASGAGSSVVTNAVDQEPQNPPSLTKNQKKKLRKKMKNMEKGRSASPAPSSASEVPEAPEAAESTSGCKKCEEHKVVCAKMQDELSWATKNLLDAQKELIDKQEEEKARHAKELIEWKEHSDKLESRLAEVDASLKMEVKEVEEQIADALKDTGTLSEEIAELRKALGEGEKDGELRKANFEELSLINEEKDSTIEKLRREIEELSAQKEGRLSPEMRKVLIFHQDEWFRLKNEDLLGTATRRQSRFISISKKEKVKQLARIELLKFHEAHEKYEKALAENIVRIQANIYVTQADLLPVPAAPAFSELLEQEMLLAEQEAAGSGRECPVCMKEPYPNARVVKCSHCPIKFHYRCFDEWINVAKHCPSCGNPVTKPKK